MSAILPPGAQAALDYFRFKAYGIVPERRQQSAESDARSREQYLRTLRATGAWPRPNKVVQNLKPVAPVPREIYNAEQARQELKLMNEREGRRLESGEMHHGNRHSPALDEKKVIAFFAPKNYITLPPLKKAMRKQSKKCKILEEKNVRQDLVSDPVSKPVKRGVPQKSPENAALASDESPKTRSVSCKESENSKEALRNVHPPDPVPTKKTRSSFNKDQCSEGNQEAQQSPTTAIITESLIKDSLPRHSEINGNFGIGSRSSPGDNPGMTPRTMEAVEALVSLGGTFTPTPVANLSPAALQGGTWRKMVAERKQDSKETAPLVCASVSSSTSKSCEVEDDFLVTIAENSDLLTRLQNQVQSRSWVVQQLTIDDENVVEQHGVELEQSKRIRGKPKKRSFGSVDSADEDNDSHYLEENGSRLSSSIKKAPRKEVEIGAVKDESAENGKARIDSEKKKRGRPFGWRKKKPTEDESGNDDMVEDADDTQTREEEPIARKRRRRQSATRAGQKISDLMVADEFNQEISEAFEIDSGESYFEEEEKDHWEKPVSEPSALSPPPILKRSELKDSRNRSPIRKKGESATDRARSTSKKSSHQNLHPLNRRATDRARSTSKKSSHQNLHPLNRRPVLPDRDPSDYQPATPESEASLRDMRSPSIEQSLQPNSNRFVTPKSKRSLNVSRTPKEDLGLTCSLCGFNFHRWDKIPLASQLRRHAENHADSSWQCGVCGEPFVRKDAVIRHTKCRHAHMKNQRYLEPVRRIPQEKHAELVQKTLRECFGGQKVQNSLEIPGRKVTVEEDLEAHRKRTTTPRNSASRCKLCHKLYEIADPVSAKHRLKRHAYTHMDNFWQCPDCDRTFKRSDNALTHIKNHHPDCESEPFLTISQSEHDEIANRKMKECFEVRFVEGVPAEFMKDESIEKGESSKSRKIDTEDGETEDTVEFEICVPGSVNSESRDGRLSVNSFSEDISSYDASVATSSLKWEIKSE